MAVRIWGKCATEGPIAVVVGEEAFYGTVENGYFELFIGKISYTKSTTLTVYNEKAKLTFENVAFGELYLATGQSNMQWTVSQCELYADEYTNAENYNKDIHLLRLTNTYAEAPLDELTPSSLSGVWSEAGKISIQLFSAVGYFFAKELNAQYNVPVGVIMTCAGGTMTGSWMDDEAYAQADKTYNVDDPSADTYHLQGGTLRYNAMIHPLRKFTVRGALWYQGENQPIEYEKISSF